MTSANGIRASRRADEADAVAEAVTGSEYVRHITRHESDIRARAAFRALIQAVAPPGAALFDFGAGTGMDARFFAERGFSVDAYDVDRKMCEYFAADCRDLIAAGRVRLEEGSYEDFLRRDRGADRPPIDFVVSNFAPLNLVLDLPALFEKFGRITAPGARLLVSVLSPYFIAEMGRAWWWRRLPALWRRGRFYTVGPHRPVCRPRLAAFAADAAAHFRLARVYRGLPGAAGLPHGIDFGKPFAWRAGATSRFMFLLFEKLR